MRILSVSALVGLVLVLFSTGPARAASQAPLQIQGWATGSSLQIQSFANDPYFSDQWYLGTLRVPSAWDRTTGSPITIAIIDTGVDTNHPELAGRIWANTDEIAANGIDDDHNGYVDDARGYNFIDRNTSIADTHGHGTGVASIIAATANNYLGIAGINYRANIMVLKALDQAGGGEYGQVTQALRYAVDNGARIVNMSFGAYGADTDLDAAIAYATARNVIIVAAAGNSGTNQIFYPASNPDVISVGSIGRTNQRSAFSNYGSNLDVVAPGEDITVAEPGNGFAKGAGTSFAAAEVTGVVSLAVAANPGLTVSQANQLLHSTATKVSSITPSSEYGYGIPNAESMVAQPPKTLSANIFASKTNLVSNGSDQATITITITDQSGVTQPGVPVTIKVGGGGNIIGGVPAASLSIGTTNSSGQVNTTLAATVAGSRTINIESEGAGLTGSSVLSFKAVAVPKYQMQWIGQSPYPTLGPGAASSLWLDIKNTGNIPWLSGGANDIGTVKLGTDRSRDHNSAIASSTWLSPNRAATMTPAIVRPGETARFSFGITAPAQPGVYKEYFTPVAEYLAWFNDLGIYWEVRVGGGQGSSALSPGYSAQLVSQTSLTSMVANSTTQVSLSFKNNGTTAWSSAAGTGQLKLGTSSPKDRNSPFYISGWSSPNRPIISGFSVAPNSTLTLNFPLHAPAQPGSYTERFQLVSEYVTWFGPEVAWNINVTP